MRWRINLTNNQKGGITVPTYIGLMKLTEQGIKEIKDAPQRIAENIKQLEEMGGKLVGMYVVMGEYDYVGIAEAPNDEIALTFLLSLGAAGQVRTTTLKAFSTNQFMEILGKLP